MRSCVGPKFQHLPATFAKQEATKYILYLLFHDVLCSLFFFFFYKVQSPEFTAVQQTTIKSVIADLAPKMKP